MNELPIYPEQPELALVSILTLMSRFSCCGSPVVAAATASQLRAIAGDERFTAELRGCAAALVEFWMHRANLMPPRESKGPLH